MDVDEQLNLARASTNTISVAASTYIQCLLDSILY